MPVYPTKRNTVYALEPLPDDCFVQTYIDGPDGRRLLATQHITNYQAAVDWAVGMADQMARPIHIVPISAAEFVKKHRERLAELDHQQRGRLRQAAITAMLEVLRDCPDPKVRVEAYDILTTLKVGQ